jgi:AraC family L-rhamnose operon regulatory protein RhaS
MYTVRDNYDRSAYDDFEWYGFHVGRDVFHSDFKLHTHDFYEASIIVSGSAKHVIGDYSYPLRRGEIYVIKKNIAHGFYDVNGLDVIDLMFFPDLFASADVQLFTLPGFRSLFIVEPDIRVSNYYPYVFTLSEEELNYVVAASNIIRELMENSREHIVLVKHFVLSLFAYLSVKYAVSHEEPQSVQLFSNAIQFMYENIAKPIKISDIASHLFISTRHLNRLFKQYNNKTPSEYLTDIRLMHAYKLLSDKKNRIAEISALCGFTDPSYFTRLFKMKFGVTPHKAHNHAYKNQFLFP